MNPELLQKVFSEQEISLKRFHSECSDILLSIAAEIYESLKNGSKVLLFGNGGSAADAQHIAAEFVGRFTRERKAYPVIALTTDTSALTAIGNDYGFDTVFKRQVEAFAKPDDLVIGITTSGNSPNVLSALQWAAHNKIKTIGFTGKTGGKLVDNCDLCFIAPADSTARIQELHIAAWHVICDLVELELFYSEKHTGEIK